VGYTHYFSKVNSTTDEALRFEMFARGARTIIEYATKYDNIQIADGMGDSLGAYEISDELVKFNGYGADSHETFYWGMDASGFNFCKTARKPYDAVVTACLIHLKDVFGDAVSIGSDGDWSEWRDGATLYRNATGLTAENPMTSEEAVA
jgi:hypothetical protein